jgi:hypothetical protein
VACRHASQRINTCPRSVLTSERDGNPADRIPRRDVLFGREKVTARSEFHFEPSERRTYIRLVPHLNRFCIDAVNNRLRKNCESDNRIIDGHIAQFGHRPFG